MPKFIHYLKSNALAIGLASLALLLIIGGVFWLATRSGDKEAVSPQTTNASSSASTLPEPTLLDQINLGNDETVPLTWTDDNSQENLIIQSDRQYYTGNGQTEVYFSVNNTTGAEQNTDIFFWFDGSDKTVAVVEKIVEGKQSQSLKIENCDLIENCKLKIENFSRKDVKGYTAGSKFNDTIASGQTNYYKAIVKYPVNQSQTEFFIEAFGDNRGYGHLDPYLAGGLVGYWTFDGATTTWSSATAGKTGDSSGNFNTGTLTNMSRSASPVAGINGQALKFNGVLSSLANASYVALASSPTLSTQMSVCAWVKPASFIGYGGDGVAIVSKDMGSLVAPYTIYGLSINTNGTISASVGDGATRIGASSALTVSLNNWVHLCYTYDGNTLKIYKNGVVDVNTASGSYTIGSNAYPPSIGVNRNLFPYIDTFSGSIDDVRVYNYALATSTIQQLYNLSRAKANININR